ncbi:MAG: TaqI-like C-terminal specificity domain-containing protein [Urechidicola sp.]|nr:TaqI-like C-terminal specificity domain-containing protein [Urechidicola sp.]
MLQNQTVTLINNQSTYENNLELTHRKDLGVFLTNNIHTIDKILDIIDFEDENILSRKFLEPSCGNGVFVIRLLEKLFKNIENKQVVSKFIESNIFFIDIDEKMIEKTKTNISSYFFSKFNEQYVGKFNDFVFDFTKRIKPKKNNSLFDSILDIPLAKFLNNIDYVIGNPPYVSLYGRRDRKKDEAQRIYYLNRYSQFPDSLKNGKINYVMLFIEQSIDFLKENGKLSFIIDLSFFETAYEHTRKYLLDKTRILSIEFNIKDFEVASGQVILEIQKTKVKNNLVQIIDAETNVRIEVDQAIWNNPKDQFKFRFNTCSLSAAIIDKIKLKKCPSLKSLYPKKNLRTCVMLLNMESLFVFENKKSDSKVKIYPYYQGSKGLKGKYQKMESTKYFHYDKELQDKVNDELKAELTAQGIKNKKRLGLGETIIYDNPKIYIRQSAKEIIASYDENPSSANNSLYVFTLRDSKKESIVFLKFLCGLLNSDIITFYSQQLNIIRFSKGKQPQIKTSDLYQIPVPTDIALQAKVANLVDKIYSNSDDDEIIKNEINSVFNDFFNITTEELDTMQNAILDF